MWLIRAAPGFATSLYLEEISLGSESNRLFLGTDAEKFTLENAICNQWQTLNSPQNITSMAATTTIIFTSGYRATSLRFSILILGQMIEHEFDNVVGMIITCVQGNPQISDPLS